MPLQAVCILCLSTCDLSGYLTSCNHFLCARCVARLPPPATAPCPFCRKAYQLARLDTPALRALFQEPSQLLGNTTKVLCSQVFHQQQIMQRMREALKLLNHKYQAAEGRVAELSQALTTERAERHALQQRFAEQQRQLDRLQAASNAAVATAVSAHAVPHASSMTRLHSATHDSGRRRHDTGCYAHDAAATPHHTSSLGQRHERRDSGPLSGRAAAASCAGTPTGGGPQRGGAGAGRGGSVAPLGWSTTSEIWKRGRAHRADSVDGASLLSSGSGAAAAGGMQGPPMSRPAQPFVPAIACTPAPQRPAHFSQSVGSISRQPSSAGRTTFRLSTPLVNSLNPSQVLPSGPIAAHFASAPKPLQNLLAAGLPQ